MKQTCRIDEELGLQLRGRTPNRRVKATLREDRQEAVGPNDVRATGFVHDQLAGVRKLRIPGAVPRAFSIARRRRAAEPCGDFDDGGRRLRAGVRGSAALRGGGGR